jgi:hypothetical protein
MGARVVPIFYFNSTAIDNQGKNLLKYVCKIIINHFLS